MPYLIRQKVTVSSPDGLHVQSIETSVSHADSDDEGELDVLEDGERLLDGEAESEPDGDVDGESDEDGEEDSDDDGDRDDDGDWLELGLDDVDVDGELDTLADGDDAAETFPPSQLSAVPVVS